MTCEAIRPLLPGYGDERLSSEERRAVRGHLAECGACRSESVRIDPTLLFGAMPPPAVDRDDVGAVLAGVRAGIALKRAERRAAEASRTDELRTGPRVGRVAAAVAALLIGAFFLRVRSTEPAPSAAARASDSAAPGLAAASAPGEAAGASRNATVYDLSTGAGEPRVVWIVDGSLDI